MYHPSSQFRSGGGGNNGGLSVSSSSSSSFRSSMAPNGYAAKSALNVVNGTNSTLNPAVSPFTPGGSANSQRYVIPAQSPSPGPSSSSSSSSSSSVFANGQLSKPRGAASNLPSSSPTPSSTSASSSSSSMFGGSRSSSAGQGSSSNAFRYSSPSPSVGSSSHNLNANSSSFVASKARTSPSMTAANSSSNRTGMSSYSSSSSGKSSSSKYSFNYSSSSSLNNSSSSFAEPGDDDVDQINRFQFNDLTDEAGGEGLADDDDNSVTPSSSSSGSRMRHSSFKESKGRDEPNINMLALIYDPPVESCEIKPYVNVIDLDGALRALDTINPVPSSSSNVWLGADWRWLKGPPRLCCRSGCNLSATLQCLGCVKAGVEEKLTHFCSANCLSLSFNAHKALHHNYHQGKLREKERSALIHKEKNDTNFSSGEIVGGVVEWYADEEDEYGVDGPTLYFTPSPSPSSAALNSHSTSNSPFYSSNFTVYCKYPPPPPTEWKDTSRDRSYTPAVEDVGRVFRIECTPFLKKESKEQKAEFTYGPLARIFTSAVTPLPAPPPPRQLIYNSQHPHLSALIHARQASSSSFSLPSVYKVMCYNVLAQIYTTSSIYPYTPPWALAWDYRKNILLREILAHASDILCLQEVQAEHFDSFFLPALQSHGYDGVFKPKTREVFSESGGVDGCATFYKRERFTLIDKFGIEYNSAAKQQTGIDKRALRRLMKGNIALILILEENVSESLSDSKSKSGKLKKRSFCVANTHIFWDPEYADVKLWQTWVLSRELEKLVKGRNLPLILMGDFNSMVDSSVYELLSTQRVSQCHDISDSVDISSYLPSDLSHLTHGLQLDSAYAALTDTKFTNYTGHFVGVLDYVFYTRQHFRLVSCLQVDNEEVLQQHTALPSPLYSSDHIALVSELELVTTDG